MVIPHSEIPILSIRPTDIFMLLVVGSLTEISHRIVVHRTKRQSSAEKAERKALRAARYQTIKKRALGPSAFVETSKLERLVLNKEKELKVFEEKRAQNVKTMEKVMKYTMTFLNLCIFLMYYGIPILEVDGFKASELGLSGNLQSDDHAEHAAAFW
eukprot:CAMPEP_0176482874 /NCGR_PEP_ID=MMETSP0200_2-20121128/3615_1 /TAXON_ID=947934 /ORGANISM="Chaetoceros sp., Strain GSL56" /LENGTH=156 /DNA_ID=CAMNT_0017879233 /DNA_START=61 /DNA_END=528 /DNA_ORIENTATION=+